MRTTAPDDPIFDTFLAAEANYLLSRGWVESETGNKKWREPITSDVYFQGMAIRLQRHRDLEITLATSCG